MEIIKADFKQDYDAERLLAARNAELMPPSDDPLEELLRQATILDGANSSQGISLRTSVVDEPTTEQLSSLEMARNAAIAEQKKREEEQARLLGNSTIHLT